MLTKSGIQILDLVLDLLGPVLYSPFVKQYCQHYDSTQLFFIAFIYKTVIMCRSQTPICSDSTLVKTPSKRHLSTKYFALVHSTHHTSQNIQLLKCEMLEKGQLFVYRFDEFIQIQGSISFLFVLQFSIYFRCLR